MEYRFSKDPLFGKYCYIDTPWIAGKNTIYRIVNSGVRSNAWVEVPISGREEVVLHDYQEDVIFVVLDTLISEDSRIKRVALKDVKIADTFRECPWCKAVCASTDKYCHECGWHIAGTSQTDSEVTRNSLRTDCTGCKFVGWYDTEFPCANCVRKNKDYYTSEQTEREGE